MTTNTSTKTPSSKAPPADDNKLPIFTKLNEIYPPSQIEETYEPLFEDLRVKFLKIFNTETQIVVRVPYTVLLFGDFVTKQFHDKIVSNCQNDLLLLISKNNNKELKVHFYDYVLEIKEQISEISNKVFSTDNQLQNFVINGFMSGVKQSKSEKNVGANILIALNASNFENNIDVHLSAFIGTLIAGLYLNDGLPKSKSVLYEYASLFLSEILKEDFEYYSAFVYFKIFLKKNSLGFHVSNSFYQHELVSDTKLAECIFESFSPEPIKAYSSARYWNKRKIECILGMALILKRFNDKITEDDLIASVKDFKTFLKIFNNSIETGIQMIETYLKKEMYTLAEIKKEIGFDLLKLLKGIEFPEGALMTKDFHLYKRLSFLFKEYQNVITLTYQAKVGDKINWVESVKKSGEMMQNSFECYSDEMKTVIKFVTDINKNVGIKTIGSGWCGKMIVVGLKEYIEDISQKINEYFERYNEKNGDGLAVAWISDMISRDCFVSELNGGFCILDPKYEDFMLDYVKKQVNVSIEEIKKVSNDAE